MGPQGRADTILNLSLFGMLGIAGYHRGITTYSFATHQWAPAHSGAPTAALYLPLHFAFMAGVVWWLCIELIGSRFGGPAWLALMIVGAFTGVVALAAS